LSVYYYYYYYEMANLSFAKCRFPEAFKTAQVLPSLKKP